MFPRASRRAQFTFCIRPRFELHRSLETRPYSALMPEIRKCAVAGSFIFKFPDGDLTSKPRVALFRRSGAVSTYQ